MNDKEKIKSAFDGMTPPETLIEETMESIQRQRRRKSLIRLVMECAASAAACFALGMFLKPGNGGDIIIFPSASVFGKGTVITIPIILFIILAAIFSGIYLKKKK